MDDFIEHTPSKQWNCSLCNLVLYTVDTAFQHCLRDATHKARVENRMRAVSTRFVNTKHLQRRARFLPDKWQNHMLAELFRYVAGDESTIMKLDDVTQLLEKYEHLERLSLLELAVWKTQCQIRANEEKVGPSSYTTVGDAARFVESQRDSWKKYRTELRSTNAIAIVIENVLPFVGTP